MPSNLTSINALEDPDLTGTDTAFRSVCALIRTRAAVDPDRIAVADAAGALTYAELVRRAGRLAARLRAAEVAPGACVGVFLDRSPEFVVAACGILWAGAAYLPVDTTSPPDRVGFVLADADVATVVTSAHHQPRLPEGPWRPLVVDGPGPEGWNSHAAPLAASDPGDLAYVIYTSGSTGRPKGVELTHANLANLVDWHVTAFGVGPSDRASQVASLGFDAAVWEIWPHLAAGATVLFADDATRRSPQLLRDWLVDAEDHHQLRPDGPGRAVDPSPLAGGHGPADPAHRRGRPAPPPIGRAAVPAGQQLRADGVHGRRHVGCGRAGDRGPDRPVDRAPDRQHDRADPGRRAAPGAAGRAGRAVPRRGARRPRVPQRPRAHGKPLRHRGGRRRRLRGGCAGLPHGRPGPAAGERRDRLPRPSGQAGQDPGFPDRARRDRRLPRPFPRCRGECRRRAPDVRRRPGRPR